MINTINAIKRIEWIDTAKGIGILLVVIGHIKLTPFIHNWIYQFHMPLFFFLSGILFKKNEPWKQCVIKKIIHLLLPYPFFLILFLPLRYITDFLCTGEWKPFQIQMLGLSYFDIPLWFLFALFITIIIMRTFYSLIKRKINIIILVILLGILGYLLLVNKIVFPFHTSRALFLLPFFALGILFKKNLSQKNVITILFSLFCFIIGIIGLINGHTCLDTLKMQIDKNPFWVYIPAYGGIMLIVYLSQSIFSYISKFKGICKVINKILCHLGKNSFYIFAIHHPIILFLNSLFWGNIVEPRFYPSYALFLIISSIIASLLIGAILKKMIPIIFR